MMNSVSSIQKKMDWVLSEDVLGEILVRLPVKSLVRFRCVSKTWCDLINSPYFADMHLGHGKNHHHRPVLLVKRFIGDEKKALLSFHSDIAVFGVAAAPDLKLPSPHPNTPIQLFGTCNGIVCIAELARSVYYHSDKDKIYLCNLATRQFLTPSPGHFGYPNGFEYSFTTSLGLGFDPSTRDYKLVKFVSYFSNEITTPPVIGVQIYQLRTNSWRNLGVTPTAITHPWPSQNFPASILLNGSLIMHWCASHPVDDKTRRILSFNMCIEAFQNIEFPRDFKSIDTESNLSVLNDSLALILFKRRAFRQLQPPPPSDIQYDHSIDIWVMMEYGIKESWVKQYSIEPFSLLGHAPLRWTVPWSFWNDNILLLQSVNGYLISCSLKDNCCREICKYDIRRFGILEAIVYEETLVSFGGIGNGLYWRKIDGDSTWN
ncbi:hypothetical protein ACH5RR_037828 [Cinchona calisaya]|uniref:F-box domain-containing protein n=1 Tax=Cinchona calisaya TaxID=153742 RepID=A0ABD2YB03_9GENT